MRSIAWVVLVAACHHGVDGNGNPVADAFVGGDTADAFAGTDATSSPPALFPMPTMADFGNVTVGAHSAAIHFVISNQGGATSITVGTASPYAIDSTTCMTSLAAGASCTLEVSVTPLATGIKAGEVHAIGDGTALTRSPLAVFGVPNDGRLQLVPGAHGFGSQTVGQTSPATTFTVTNPGTATVGPLGVVPGGSSPTDFVLAANTCAGAMVPPAGTCTFTVAFAPATTGGKQATITITGSSALATVTGSGI